jgi:hypothetical protein
MSRLRSAALASAAAVLLAAPSHAQAAADEAYLGRMTAVALDERCALFPPEVREALDAGAALVRNALLRAGWSERTLQRVDGLARSDAEPLACVGPEAVQIATDVNNGYDGWRGLREMAFAGDQRTWTAKRPATPEAWLLIQTVAAPNSGPAKFGIARRADGTLQLALALPSDARPGAARLLLRDPALAPMRLEAEMIRIVGVADRHPLAAAAAPDVFTRAVWAADRSDHDKASPYAEEFGGSVAMLWFPARLTQDLAALDPREVVAIDVDRAGGDPSSSQERFYVEVGDFAPAAVLARILDQASPAASPANPASLTR